MPNMRTANKAKPVAILCSDMHLTTKQPACRADKDWMGVQAHYLEQVRELAVLHAGVDVLPVIIAGDIFDRWNPPPELITFALKELPLRVMAIPGQHDLPNHRTEDIHKSGYGVLLEAHAIHHLDGAYGAIAPGVHIYGFGWEREVTRPIKKVLNIAVVHRYIWDILPNSYPGAPVKAQVNSLLEEFGKYNVAVFGDNHKGFSTKLKNGTRIFNCGGFIRRKSDEIGYQPQVGILMDDGNVKVHYLDTSIDRFHKDAVVREEVQTEHDVKAFIKQLEGLTDHGLDYPEAVKAYLRSHPVSKKVQDLVLSTLNVT